jgi:hypothetical protein
MRIYIVGLGFVGYDSGMLLTTDRYEAGYLDAVGTLEGCEDWRRIERLWLLTDVAGGMIRERIEELLNARWYGPLGWEARYTRETMIRVLRERLRQADR